MTRTYNRKPCRFCGGSGHQSARCLQNPDRTIPLSEHAAHWVQDTRSTLRDAVKRFGISHQAVHQAWKRLGLGEVPTKERWRSSREAIVELAGESRTVREISFMTGRPNSTIIRVLHREGVDVPPAQYFADRHGVALLAAVEEVRSGGLTLAALAGRLGARECAVARFYHDQGIKFGRGKKGFSLRADANGGVSKSQRARDLVAAGHTVQQAARALGCSRNTVWTALKSPSRPNHFAAIAECIHAGMSNGQIVDELYVSRSYVWRVRRRLQRDATAPAAQSHDTTA